jgi:hypothetical protein
LAEMTTICLRFETGFHAQFYNLGHRALKKTSAVCHERYEFLRAHRLHS